MKIVVVGGAGAMALSFIMDLLEQKDVSQIVVADIREDKVKERVAELKDERLVARFLDLSDIERSVTMFKGADTIANMASYDTCIPTTKAALEAGANYLDLGALSGPETDAQLALSDGFKKKGITAILGIGAAPGLSNVMASYLVDKLDRVESIDIKWAAVDKVADEEHSRPLYWAYAIDTIIDEFSEDSLLFEDGKLKHIPPRSYPEMVAFKEPIGTTSVASTAHPEPATLPRSFEDKGIKRVSWKIGFSSSFEAKMRFLCDLGFASKETINVKGQMISPREVLLALLDNLPEETKKASDFRVEGLAFAKGEKAGEKVEYILRVAPSDSVHERLKNIPGSYRTGICASIAALMLARGQIEQKGAFPPELCIPHELYLKEQANRGMEVEVTQRFMV